MRLLWEQRKKKKEFKMSLILNLLDLDPKSRSQAINEIAKKRLEIPCSKKKSITRATIYHWLKEYRSSPDKGETLFQKRRSDRGSFRKLTEPQKMALKRWRKENPYRTAEDLRQDLLAHDSTNKDPVPCKNTIARYLRDVGLDRKTLTRQMEAGKPGKRQKTVRLAFESAYPQQLWQGDTKGPGLMVVDPRNPGQLVAAKLIKFIDDYARFITGARYFVSETEENVMAVFRSAIATYGVPDALYVDLGSPYTGRALETAARLVGCRIVHTPQGDAPAKGKAERSMRPFNEKLESELALLPGPLTLDQANEFLGAFISRYYHQRVHSVTGERPVDRYAAFPPEYRRFVSEEILAIIFLPCTTSKVSKTCLIHLHKIQYLVPDPRLIGQKVEVRYNPLDRSKVFVFFKDEFRGEAYVYSSSTDFLGRQAELKKMEQLLRTTPEIEIPPAGSVPYYSFLERTLAEYRLARESFADIDAELSHVRAQKEMIAATMTSHRPAGGTPPATYTIFGPQEFTHLLSTLLRRPLTTEERLKVSVLWKHYGPLEDSLVKTTVGRLLGEGIPSSPISAYLDAIRVAACTSHKPNKED